MQTSTTVIRWLNDTPEKVNINIVYQSPLVTDAPKYKASINSNK